ncbi:unnamed protein product [Ilex paraguariensis]|uniref:Uncharacterized protein n=1 Tax=Ilex paraguariensis TaxID=185542 RepID=A0ABC8V1E9_9AQUA
MFNLRTGNPSIGGAPIPLLPNNPPKAQRVACHGGPPYFSLAHMPTMQCKLGWFRQFVESQREQVEESTTQQQPGTGATHDQTFPSYPLQVQGQWGNLRLFTRLSMGKIIPDISNHPKNAT